MPPLLTHAGRNMEQRGHADPAGVVEAVVPGGEQAPRGMGEACSLPFLPPPSCC